MGYIIARWWTFGDPTRALVWQVSFLQTLAGNGAETRLRLVVFDGRRHESVTLRDVADVRKHLPPRFCEADVTSPRLSHGAAARAGEVASTLGVAPTSALWARVTRRKPNNARDHRAAMTFRSFESYARVNRIRGMPHVIEGWCRPPRGMDRPAQLERAIDGLREILAQPRQGFVAGGVDFVSSFVEMGSHGILGLLSPTPSAWPQLRYRFDDMHKIMFGRTPMFEPLSRPQAKDTFEQIIRVQGGRGAGGTIAVARTGRTMRTFVHPARELTVSGI